MEGVPFTYIQLKGFIFEKLYIHLAGSDPSMHIYRFGKIAGLCHKSGITNTKIFRDRAISKVSLFKYFPMELRDTRKIGLLGGTSLRRSGRNVLVEVDFALFLFLKSGYPRKIHVLQQDIRDGVE